ncbi:MAG: hypothetical protein OMM_15177, partial [Candidatus Magnetoglobus multicellularis str. Araruama]
MKQIRLFGLLIAFCMLLFIVYHLYTYSINVEKEDLNGGKFSENLDLLKKDIQGDQAQVTSDHIVNNNKSQNNHSQHLEYSQRQADRQWENTSHAGLKPIKRTDMQTLQRAGITYETILKKHSGNKELDFKKLTSGYDIPDDKWDETLTLYTTIKDPLNEQEKLIKARSLLDMAASK